MNDLQDWLVNKKTEHQRKNGEHCTFIIHRKKERNDNISEFFEHKIFLRRSSFVGYLWREMSVREIGKEENIYSIKQAIYRGGIHIT